MTRPTAAVVGSGVAGLTAAYLLQRRYDVTLFEADGRLGGHAHTHELPTVDRRTVDVGTRFIVHNRRTYPNLLRLFGELGVATQESVAAGRRLPELDDGVLAFAGAYHG